MTTIGEKIRALRKSIGLTQTDFAHKILISRSNLAQIEVGNANPTFETLSTICGIFDIDANLLFDGEVKEDAFLANIVNENVINKVTDKKGNPDVLNESGANSPDKSTIDYFAASKKVTAFYNAVRKRDPELDAFLSNLSELESLKNELSDYIDWVNLPLNEVYDNIITADYKTVVSDEFIIKNTSSLQPLKERNNSVEELIHSINAVLLHEKNQQAAGATLVFKDKTIEITEPGSFNG